jgi:hypothetical protein
LVFGLTLAITDVAGPPLPPERFSSLPIRGADAAAGGGADGSELDVNCSMAQTFEIPTETGWRPGTLPTRRSLSAPILPVGSMTGIWVGRGLTASAQMSSGDDLRQARSPGPATSQG